MTHPTDPDHAGERALLPYKSDGLIEWSLRPGRRAVLFLIPIMALSVVLAGDAILVAWVTYQVENLTIIDIHKALGLDPGNDHLVHRLGLVYSNDPTDLNLTQAVSYLRQAVELNPRHWDYWLDLGTSCDFVGNTPCSDEAFARALSLNPMTPALQWALGNHYLLTNREEEAFPYFRRLLELEPHYLQNTFRVCLRATHDPQAVYSGVVPQGKDASPRFAYLMFLCSTADYESALKIWGQMISGPDRTPRLALVKPFLNFLIEHNQIDDAGTVWSDLQQAGIIPPQPHSQGANLVYDEGFESPTLNTGFDWRVSDSPDLTFDLADSSAYKRSKCVRIEFVVGRNAEYDLLAQVVRIKPNTRYQLSAYVRSDHLTSESGPRLRAVEIGCERCVAQSGDSTVGTTPWHQVNVEFETQPQTQAVKISFWRPIDQTFSRDITGTIWLDDVALRPMDASGAELQQARNR